jgi:hypothetical protein
VLASYQAGTGFEGLGEYEPPNADNSQIATGFPDACLVSDPSIAFGKPNKDDPDANPAWDPGKDSCLAVFPTVGGLQTNPERRHIVGTAPQSGYLVLRLLRYPAWTIRLNGQLLTGDRLSAVIKRDDGLIAIPVPQGPVDLTVDWTTTPDAPLGRWLSSISVLLLFALCLLERKSASPRRR